MEEKLVSFEVAKLAKEKGFDVKAKWLQLYLLDSITNTVDTFSASQICLPTQSLLQKYLREVHKIDIVIHRSFSMDNSYHYCIIMDGNYDIEMLQECIPDRSYEEALENALFNALKLI